MFRRTIISLPRALVHSVWLRPGNGFQPSVRHLSKNAGTSNNKILLKSVVAGIVIGTGYVAYDSFKPANDHKINEERAVFTVDNLPDVPISKKIVSPKDKSNLDLVLFQYQTCPFCCKVRAYLDANGFAYSVVEVDSLMKRNLKWSPYKKVPSVLARQKDGRYVQLTESSMIISALESYLQDPSQDIGELAKLYPQVSYFDDAGKKKHDVLNKYFIMYKGKAPKNLSQEDLK